MDRMFMTRVDAIANLMARRQSLQRAIDGRAKDNRAAMLRDLDSVNQLVLDVRAGRTKVFHTDATHSTEIVVTD